MKMIVLLVKLDIYYEHFFNHNGRNNSVRFPSLCLFSCAIVNRKIFVESLSCLIVDSNETKIIQKKKNEDDCIVSVSDKQLVYPLLCFLSRGQVNQLMMRVFFLFFLSLHSILLYIIIYAVRLLMFCLYVCS